MNIKEAHEIVDKLLLQNGDWGSARYAMWDDVETEALETLMDNVKAEVADK